ncbi:MutH/Sau3AI family endonuclease [[Acholeplasma] multilocale]|uniref:MutH/Sau3AI family endonuclease n=1 Tax=[Acholeplasma] multilocale TaxID=264638 RepID=UPI00047ACE23|nr:MutH/Sau3AI family endonuclease [[Acholeplasma] multilocale]
MKEIKYKDIEEILQKAKRAEGQRIIDLVGDYGTNNDKGKVGNLIQKGYFGIPVNNNPEADFKELGFPMELKVTPVKRLQKPKKELNSDLVAKERLVLSMIDYNNIDLDESFFTSHVFEKTESTLLMHYLHDYNNEIKTQNKILYSHILDLNEDLTDMEKNIIEEDFQIIRNKIITGNAHELSESNTKILAATTKGQGNQKPRTYKFSDINAKGRAFSFKPSFMTLLFNRKYNNAKIITPKSGKSDIFSFFEEIVDKYKGINIYEDYIQRRLKQGIHEPKDNKSMNAWWMKKVVNEHDENFLPWMETLGYKMICITIDEKGKIQESMPLSRVIDPQELGENEFLDSYEFEQLVLNKYIFVTFKKIVGNNHEIYLDGIFEFNISENDKYIKNLEKVWNDTKIKFQGEPFIQFKQTKNGLSNNLIKMKDDLDFHIRPKGRNKEDKYLLNDNKTLITKQTFWVNRDVLQEFKDKKAN